MATSLRVLVVDDNVDVARTFSILIRRAGHEAQTAHDGPGAIETALDFRPDVILLDIGLPHMDGHEVARRIRGEAALDGVVLVAMTGYGGEADRRRSRQSGFNHHLVKPATGEKLRQILAEVADTKRGAPADS
jgi:two-component system, chemotaxis family, CheB/CheR fusion protein